MLICQSVEPCNNAGIKLMKHGAINLLGHHDILNLCYHLLKAWSLKITSLEIRPFLNDATESTKSDKGIGSSEKMPPTRDEAAEKCPDAGQGKLL